MVSGGVHRGNQILGHCGGGGGKKLKLEAIESHMIRSKGGKD